MKITRIILLLTALLMTLSISSLALADDFEYEGDAPLRPELMLRCDPDAGVTWSWAFAKGGVAEIASDYTKMETLSEQDPWNTYEGEGGYEWIRVDGVSAGVDTLSLACSGEGAPLKSLTIEVSVDDDLGVTILSIATGDAAPVETTPDVPVSPVLTLAADEAKRCNWAPDNSYNEGLTVDSEYKANALCATLVGTGEDYDAQISFAYDGPDIPIMTLDLSAVCEESNNVIITDLRLKW